VRVRARPGEGWGCHLPGTSGRLFLEERGPLAATRGTLIRNRFYQSPLPFPHPLLLQLSKLTPTRAFHGPKQ